jgi:hypothetical protein
VNPLSGLTWTCHVCGRERPDDRISVHHVTIDNGKNDGIPITANVRYCNDRQSCYVGAEEVDFVKKLRELWA